MMSLILDIFAPETRSLENPSTSFSDPDAWLIDAWGGRTSSGIRVDGRTALTYSPVWRAVNLVSRDVAKLPLLVYQRTGTGKRRAVDHPAYRLLKNKPNPQMNAFVFKALLTKHALLRGNGYAYIVRRGDAAPAELWPLDPVETYPVRENGRLWYVTSVNGEMRKIPPRDVLHIRVLTDDGILGVGVIEKARESIGLGLAVQKYGAIYFGNAARPAVILEHPGRLSQEARERLRESWERMHKGLDNAHRTAILEEGMKAHEFPINNEDAQFLQTRQFEIREVANWFGVPPHKLGDTTRTSYASLEQENQAYLDESLDPWLVAWESECWDKLLTEVQKQRDTHVIEFVRNALVRANLTSRGQYYRMAIQGGWMSRDEVRALENMNPIPGGEGKKFFVPLNMTVTGQSDDTQTDAGRAADALRKALRQTVERMCKRLTLHAERARKADRLDDWLADDIERDHRTVVTEALTPLIEAAHALGLCSLGIDAIVERFFADMREALRRGVEPRGAYADLFVRETLKEKTDALPERA